jgi:hypothetical protein
MNRPREAYQIFVMPEDEFADNNPRECPIFRTEGYHLYGRDGTCVDCSKPTPRKTDNGK